MNKITKGRLQSVLQLPKFVTLSKMKKYVKLVLLASSQIIIEWRRQSRFLKFEIFEFERQQY